MFTRKFRSIHLRIVVSLFVIAILAQATVLTAISYWSSGWRDCHRSQSLVLVGHC